MKPRNMTKEQLLVKLTELEGELREAKMQEKYLILIDIGMFDVSQDMLLPEEFMLLARCVLEGREKNLHEKVHWPEE